MKAKKTVKKKPTKSKTQPGKLDLKKLITVLTENQNTEAIVVLIQTKDRPESYQAFKHGNSRYMAEMLHSESLRALTDLAAT